MKKNSYKDIGIYTVVILGILMLYEVKFLSYTAMSVFIVIALAIFVAYNFRNSIKNLLHIK